MGGGLKTEKVFGGTFFLDEGITSACDVGFWKMFGRQGAVMTFFNAVECNFDEREFTSRPCALL